MGAVMARRARDAGATRARVGAWMITTVGLSPIAFVGVMRARTHRGGVGEGGSRRWEGSRRLVPYDLGARRRDGRRGPGSWEGGVVTMVVGVRSPSSPYRRIGTVVTTVVVDATRRDATRARDRRADATRRETNLYARTSSLD